MSLQSRSQKIHKVSQTESTRLFHRRQRQSTGVWYEVWHVDSVNSNATYQVKIEWVWRDGIQVIKSQLISHLNDNPHPANNCGTICYHILGVLKKKAILAGKEIHFSHTLENAKKAGGQVMRVVNLAGKGEWISYREEKIFKISGPVNECSIPERQTFKDRVKLMRGPTIEESYID